MDLLFDLGVFHKVSTPQMNLVVQLHPSIVFVGLVMMTHSTGLLGMQFCALDLSVINANDVVLLYPFLIAL